MYRFTVSLPTINQSYHSHEAAHDLLCVVVELGVGERDAGAVERHPRAPLDPHHERAHGEDHAQHDHVVGRQVLAGLGRLAAAAVGVKGRKGVGVPGIGNKVW